MKQILIDKELGISGDIVPASEPYQSAGRATKNEGWVREHNKKSTKFSRKRTKDEDWLRRGLSTELPK